ncbi:MAG: hypothetical protein CM15mP112_05370 [Flavobacteriales bacterium]|nr:MAG: hypothetical protein CM15mP112_05370 [Flavobacteriales bacterium]
MLWAVLIQMLVIITPIPALMMGPVSILVDVQIQQQNYDPNACVDDGSCIINTVCSNPTPTGLHAIDIIHNRARIKWDNMTSANCTPEQYRVQYRIQGTSTWSVKMLLIQITVEHLIKQVAY